jgi:membrane fusion protein, multidrug efflux system
MNPLRLVCVCMTALLLAACARPEPPPAPIRAVRTMTVGTSQANVAHDYAAEIRSRSESRLGFRVAGKLLSREVNLGDRVRAGQVLARLDGQDLRLGADAARAGVNAAQVQFDLAMADLRRYRELHQQGFIGAAELDRREAGVRSAQSQLDQAKAQWSVQGNQAAYATLVADAAGVVTAVEAEPGQVLAAGTPVVRMAYDGPRDAVFSVPEDRASAACCACSCGVRTPKYRWWSVKWRPLRIPSQGPTRSRPMSVQLRSAWGRRPRCGSQGLRGMPWSGCL